MSSAQPLPFRVRPRAELAACAVVALVAAWFYFWTVQQPGLNSYTTRDPQGYYPFQAAGFRSGHLYLALDPHPALLALKDPYDPVANAPYRIHDLSLFKGHYYMYFGATPALLLFWPFAAVTGRYLTEPCAVALFCTGAVWAGIALLFAVRRRYFPAAPSWVLVAGAICVAFATPLTGLSEAPQFYQVPITCAIFLQALTLAAAYRSLHSERRLAWLAAAGLLFGLSLGCRPNYLFGAVALLVPIAAAATQRPAECSYLRAFLRSCFATFLPTLACGIAILAYNHARFGLFGEFGMHFQLAGERVTDLKAVSAKYILPHYFEYLLSPGVWQSYFPFFASTAGKPYGILRYLPWTWLLLFAFARPPSGPAISRRYFAMMVGLVAWTNLTLLSCFFGTTARYPGDFAQAMVLLAGVGALAAGEWSSAAPARRWVSWCLCLLAGTSVLFCAAVYFSAFPEPDTLLPLARAANWPSYAWQRAHHQQFGGLHLELRLPERHPSAAEPLVETGRQPDQRDWLQIEYTGPARARLGVFHAGTGLFEGKEFDIPADRRVAIDIHAGSLVPPFSYPVFDGWSRDDYASARSNLQVKVNGVEVLGMALDSYESSPSDLRIGRMGWFTGGMDQVFSGDIVAVERLPLAPPQKVAPLFNEALPIELTVYMPSGKSGGADPVLLCGSGIQSDLVYCVYDGINRVKFAFDHWGNGGPQSESVSYDPLVPHKIVVFVEATAGSEYGRLAVLFDGKPMINTRQVFYPTSPATVIIGTNKFGSTTAGHQFTGEILGHRQLDLGSLPPMSHSGNYGAVEMAVMFPFAALGTNEPLVVTGTTGAGDFIFVRYLDATHISVGFDHWSVGGIVSPPVEVSYAEPHHLTVTMGSLYPEGSPDRRSGLLQVILDGKPVLQGRKDTYPSRDDEIEIGKNQIGGSTCGPLFTGRILSPINKAAPSN
jgi:hypothetical protein